MHGLTYCIFRRKARRYRKYRRNSETVWEGGGTNRGEKKPPRCTDERTPSGVLSVVCPLFAITSSTISLIMLREILLRLCGTNTCKITAKTTNNGGTIVATFTHFATKETARGLCFRERYSRALQNIIKADVVVRDDRVLSAVRAIAPSHFLS